MRTASEAFDPLRTALEQAGVRYAIGGSWASTAFGEPRFTNDLDILAEFTPQSLQRFLESLSDLFFVDPEEARAAFRLGRPFNVIYMPIAFKFDFFSASAFTLGTQELDRAVFLSGTGLSEAPVPFVTAEDILLAKLNWFKEGDEVSTVQWRDIEGIVRSCRDTLDYRYLEISASGLGILSLLERALRETQ